MPPAQNPRSGCPVVFALDVFGDRWTLLVIRDMVLRGFTTYGEFLKAGEQISTNILADRLKRLEARGLVTKRQDPENRAKKRYTLSEQGLDLVPVLVEMMRWSAKHDPESPVSEGFRRQLDDPAELARAILKRHEEAGEPSRLC